MLFTLISETLVEVECPFVAFVESTVNVEFLTQRKYIFHTYETCFKYFPNADFSERKVEHSDKNIDIWWVNTISEMEAFIENSFKELLASTEKKLLYDLRFYNRLGVLDDLYKYENDELLCLYNPDLGFTIFDKIIASYFNLSTDFLRESYNMITYESSRALLKSCCFLSEKFSKQNINSYLKRNFGDDWYYYHTYFLESLENYANVNDIKVDVNWKRILKCQDYFSSVKIYNLKNSVDVDFDIQRDEEGKEYISHEYSSNSATGRVFAKNVGNYQIINTLQKDKRYLFEAEEGYLLAEFDIKTFEFELFRQLFELEISKSIDSDTPLVKNKLDIDDIHVYVSEKLGLIATKEKAREYGKTINYAIIFGMSLENLGTKLHSDYPQKTKEEYIAIISNLKSYKYALEFTEFLWSQKEEKGFVPTYFGRNIKIHKAHAILNYYIQGTGVDIFFSAIDSILNFFDQFIDKKIKILLQNHDSILVQLPFHEHDKEVHLAFYIREIRALLNEREGQKLKFDVSVKVGENWGEMIDYDLI